MYRVYVDDICIHDSVVSTGSLMRLIDPELTMSDNAAGSFKFKILPENIGYNALKKLTSVVKVVDDGDVIWSGRIISETEDFYKQRSVTCEGALAYLNDTIQPPAEYHDISPRALLKKFLDIHNSQVDSTKQFQVGAVTVKDPNDSLYRYTNYETTWECIEDKLIERLGGHMYIRREKYKMYIDWLEDYLSINTQIIDFGKNLMNFTKNFDMTDLVTVIIPRGERLEESPIQALDAYLTVASVNNGSIFVENKEAVKRFGKITKVVDWDDVTEPANLLRKAKEYLEDQQFDQLELEVSAVDLHYLNPSIENIKLLDKVRCRSLPHGMDRYFPVKEVTIQLNNPESTTYIFGDTINGSLTDVNNALAGQITNQIKANIAFENKKNEAISSDMNEKFIETNQKIVDSNNRTDGLINGVNGRIDGVVDDTNTALNNVNKRVDTTNSTIAESAMALNQRMDEEAEKAKNQTDEALKEAKENASEILRLATNGFITIVTGKNGSEALIVSETQDVTKSKKFWKWNVNGLGYTNDGGNTYGLAITMDGAIVADYITAGTLNAGIIKTGVLSDINGNSSFNLTTGYLKMNKGAINIGNGIFMVDENGNVAMTKGSININDGNFKVDSNGNIEANFGTIAGFNLNPLIGIWDKYISLDHIRGLQLSDRNTETHIGGLNITTLNESSNRGVTINITENATVAGIVSKTSSSGNYIPRLLYFNKAYDTMSANTLVAFSDIDCRGNTIKYAWIDPDTGGGLGGINGTLHFWADYEKNEYGQATLIGEVSMTFKNGILVDGSWAQN